MRLNLEKYLQTYQDHIQISEVKDWENGARIYILDRCPFNEDHGSKGETCLIHNPDGDGPPTFKCKHDSCSERNWRDFRMALGPISDECLEAVEPKSRSTNRISGYRFDAPPRPKFQPGRTTSTYDLEPVPYAQLWETLEEERYLVDKILVEGQPTIFGGPSKSLKTSVALDLAISVASGVPFLGRFEVPEPGAVFFISAESGRKTISQVVQTIGRVRGLDAESYVELTMSFKAPNLSDPGHLAAVERQLKEWPTKLLILDPAYMLLGVSGDASKNLFMMGEILGTIADMCQSCGTTMMLLHHTNKQPKGQNGNPLTIEDLAYSGFAQFLRQYVLISRLKPYEEGTHKHEMQLSVGGSAGHSGRWEFVADEGSPMDPIVGRKWEITFDDGDLTQGRSSIHLQIVDTLMKSHQPLSCNAIAGLIHRSRGDTKTAILTLQQKGEVREIPKGNYSMYEYAKFESVANSMGDKHG